MVRPDQVWSTDITYIRLAHGFAYLVAIIDWYSRRVVSWLISNSMEAVFCVDCLEEALRRHGKPEIFNNDQGSHFRCFVRKFSLSCDDNGIGYWYLLWSMEFIKIIQLEDYGIGESNTSFFVFMPVYPA